MLASRIVSPLAWSAAATVLFACGSEDSTPSRCWYEVAPCDDAPRAGASMAGSLGRGGATNGASSPSSRGGSAGFGGSSARAGSSGRGGAGNRGFGFGGRAP